MKEILRIAIWVLVSLLGATAYAVITFRRGEAINAAWFVTAALCTYAIGLRFYSKWIAAKGCESSSCSDTAPGGSPRRRS